MRWIDEWTPSKVKTMDGSHRIRPHEISIPAIFFDGACNEGITGCGAWIKLSRRERIHLHWNGGPGTNNKAEIMALWGGLLAAVNLNLTEVHIYGDSKLIIDCISGRQNMNNPGLHGWLKRTQRLWHRLDNHLSLTFTEKTTWRLTGYQKEVSMQFLGFCRLFISGMGHKFGTALFQFHRILSSLPVSQSNYIIQLWSISYILYRYFFCF